MLITETTQSATIISSAAAKLGYSQLKSVQHEVVTKFVSGKDVFVSLPTGSGKSLCYAVLPSVFDDLRCQVTDHSMVIVVSPLIALIKDQIETFTRKGLTCLFADSTSDEVQHSVLAGECQLLYISPETLLANRQWREIVQTPVVHEKLVGFIVDEAHCVKKWYVVSSRL